MSRAILTVYLSCLLTGQAHADWANVGIAFHCDKASSVFKVISTMSTSLERYDVNAPEGFIEIEAGKDQLFFCYLDGADISMTVDVYGPQPRGMGQGGGVILIDELVVNGRNVLEYSTNFNWQVMGERVLTEITIEKSKNKYTSTLCESDGWDWYSQYSNKTCKIVAE